MPEQNFWIQCFFKPSQFFAQARLELTCSYQAFWFASGLDCGVPPTRSQTTGGTALGSSTLVPYKCQTMQHLFWPLEAKSTKKPTSFSMFRKHTKCHCLFLKVHTLHDFDVVFKEL